MKYALPILVVLAIISCKKKQDLLTKTHNIFDISGTRYYNGWRTSLNNSKVNITPIDSTPLTIKIYDVDSANSYYLDIENKTTLGYHLILHPIDTIGNNILFQTLDQPSSTIIFIAGALTYNVQNNKISVFFDSCYAGYNNNTSQSIWRCASQQLESIN